VYIIESRNKINIGDKIQPPNGWPQMNKYFPTFHLYKNAPYYLTFTTTLYCDNHCAHCCENSGTHQKYTFIEPHVIKTIIAGATWDKRFNRNVVFTGGEIFTSYFRDETAGYIPDILSFCLNNGISTDIKTNGNWVNSDKREQIINDLVNLTGDKRKLQMSLSLDGYHKNYVKNNASIITEIANSPSKMDFHISGFSEFSNLRDKMLQQIRANGIELENGMIFRDEMTLEQVMVANQKNIIRFTAPKKPFWSGRAKNLGEHADKKSKFAKLRIFDGESLIVNVRPDGYIQLGENTGENIRLKYMMFNVFGNLRYIRHGFIIKTLLCDLSLMFNREYKR
jgi:organic radical activating enzyme